MKGGERGREREGGERGGKERQRRERGEIKEEVRNSERDRGQMN